jgi:hypothetical protein
MKKCISFKSYKLGMAILLLSASTMSFAQRERGGRGGGERGAERQSFSAKTGSQADAIGRNRQRQMPGAPSIDRSRMGQQPQQRSFENRNPVMQRPTAEAPVAQRREERQPQRKRRRLWPGTTSATAAATATAYCAKPSVNNNRTPSDARWNNRINRSTPDNSRITANNNRGYNNNRNYNNGNYNNNRNL